jgi:topoisomerase IA-like protein
MPTKKPGLYANIHAKQERIAHGSKEKMRKPGEEGAPSTDDFKKSEKTKKPAAARKTAAKKTASKKTAAKKTATKKAARKTAATSA